MINGVLVERTVKDVVPALKTNSDGLKKVLEDLVKQYNGKQVEMEKWKVRFLPLCEVWENWSADWCVEEKQYSSCATVETWLMALFQLDTQDTFFFASLEYRRYVRLHGRAWLGDLGVRVIRRSIKN